MSPLEFSRLINRFYNVATEALIHTDALIDKIIGDQVAAIFVPGIAGQGHASCALEAARKILYATGHDGPEDPWIPLGIGVHTGIAFVGSVGSGQGTSDITVLGDTANTTARLSSLAHRGEILVSRTAATAAGLAVNHLESRQLQLKGKNESVQVYVIARPAASLTLAS
jgi:adenylate cyclase